MLCNGGINSCKQRLSTSGASLIPMRWTPSRIRSSTWRAISRRCVPLVPMPIRCSDEWTLRCARSMLGGRTRLIRRQAGRSMSPWLKTRSMWMRRSSILRFPRDCSRICSGPKTSLSGLTTTTSLRPRSDRLRPRKARPRRRPTSTTPRS